MCGCLSCTPYWIPGPQPRHVPWLGIKLATLRFSGQHSIHWATPARERIFCLFLSFFLFSVCFCFSFCLVTTRVCLLSEYKSCQRHNTDDWTYLCSNETLIMDLGFEFQIIFIYYKTFLFWNLLTFWKRKWPYTNSPRESFGLVVCWPLL